MYRVSHKTTCWAWLNLRGAATVQHLMGAEKINSFRKTLGFVATVICSWYLSWETRMHWWCLHRKKKKSTIYDGSDQLDLTGWTSSPVPLGCWPRTNLNIWTFEIMILTYTAVLLLYVTLYHNTVSSLLHLKHQIELNTDGTISFWYRKWKSANQKCNGDIYSIQQYWYSLSRC